MPVSKFAFTTAGTIAAYAAPAAPSTLATVASVTTPMATYYPLLDIAGRDIVDGPTSTTTNEAAKPTSTDATTIIVDEDETWEAEYLKAMEEAEEMMKESKSGKRKRCGNGDGTLAKRCGNFCGTN